MALGFLRMGERLMRVPDNVTLCANNCGRPGSPATKNMCHSCFQAALALNSPSCSGHEKRRSSPIRTQERLGSAGGFVYGEESHKASSAEAAASLPAAPARAVNRCSGCRRKVGLTGFRCRCGELFCADHRYSDRHDCSYDYKAAGREAIERDNPVVKAAKIVRI